MSRASTADSATPPINPAKLKLSVAPALRQSPSLSNLRVHSYNGNAGADEEGLPTVGMSSSASSVFDLELDLDGKMLLQDDLGEDSEESAVSPPVGIGSELRDQLRRTLTSTDITAIARAKHPAPPPITASLSSSSYSYYVLTDAGKPVFISQPTSSELEISSLIGIIQALISVFIDDNDKLKCINTKQTRITFLLRSPLYYVCVCTPATPNTTDIWRLEYLHQTLLSLITATQLDKIFRIEKRNNFDLGRMLGGAGGEVVLEGMCKRQNNFGVAIAMIMGALRVMRLDRVIRDKAGKACVPTGKVTKDILYVVLLNGEEIVTLIRPKKHSVHPADIHILLTLLSSPSLVNSPAAALWVPLCLPKWNPGRMVNAYVVNLTSLTSPPVESTPPKLTLVCISGGNDFDAVRAWSDECVARLCKGESESIVQQLLHPSTYTVSSLSIPGLRHFVYKSRGMVQITFPSDFDTDEEESRRLLTLYQIVHDAIHVKGLGSVIPSNSPRYNSVSPSSRTQSQQRESLPLKTHFIRTSTESVLGWITSQFEVYVTLSPWIPKPAAVGAANSVVEWVGVGKEDRDGDGGGLFLRDAPIF